MIKTLQRCIAMAFFVTMAGMFLAGCATTTSTYGVKLDQNKVSQIQKGVTTRAEVETLFGPPTSVSLMSDGRRTIFYSFAEASVTVDPKILIPIVGIFVKSSSGQTKTQMLQIILNKADIVEDYEFTDSAKTNSGLLDAQMTSTPVTQEKK